MHKLCTTFLLFLCGWAAAFAQSVTNKFEPAPPKSRWTIDSPHGLVMDVNTGLVSASNGVVVKYAGAVLTADSATVNEKTGEVVAEGNVILQYRENLWQGQSLHYNFITHKIIAENFKSGHGLLFTRGRVLVGEQKEGVYVGATALLTTDDYAEPSYRVHAKSIVIVTGEYIEAKQATLYWGKVPVFYLPFYKRSLKLDGPRFEITPGYRTAFGPYLLNTYHWYRSEPFDSSIHLDGRQKRGVGAGPDFNWRLKEYGDGTLKGYYARDEEPPLDANQTKIDDDRYRVWFAHQANPRPGLSLKGVARYQSDPLVIHDFFEGEYKRNVQPSTFFEGNQLWQNYSLNVLAQPRINDFFETVERIPDIKLTGLRQQIGNTPLYYESDSSFGYFRRRFPTGSTNDPFAAIRADTYHQVVMPYTFFNWLNVIPRAGGRFTHYGEASGDGATTREQERGVFNTGTEVTFKASRVWPEVQSRFWEMDGLRHIIQPSFNYAYVPNPTVSPRRLPQFDYEVPTTRLLPIEFPDYNAIDSIDSQNVLRLGLRNKFQTKRKGFVDNVAHWALYTDWRLTQRDDQTTFSDLYSDLDLKPFSWLTLSSQLRWGVENHELNEGIHQLMVAPNDIWSVSVGHRWLREDPRLGINFDDNLLFTTFYYRFNENWGFRMSHQFQARDSTLEEQYYTVYRDFRSWTGALTFRVRDNRTGPIDYTVAFTFSLKVFPRYHMQDDRVQPTTLVGY